MIALQTRKEYFSGIKPFDMMISYVEIDSKSPLNVHDAHIHDECEIYINVSGDVSFAVENTIYPITHGGIIITRPLEYHHCIYHTNQLHKHFWILFSASGNEHLFDVFYNRKAGHGNLLMLSHDQTEELLALCQRMTNGYQTQAEKYYCFFKLIHLLDHADTVNTADPCSSDYVIKAIDYINRNLSNHLSVAQIARECNVSVNTLERRFLQTLHLSPYAYIKKKRLANAAKLLSEGHTVTEASEMSGFCDCSSFIALFKNAYQTTPLQYKKAQKR